MNTTQDNSTINSDSDQNSQLNQDDFLSMDLGNSFDYVSDYYINTYDYTLDIENEIQNNDTTKNKGCHVISTDDSIHIIHENGTDKHIQKEKNNKKSNRKSDKKSNKNYKHKNTYTYTTSNKLPSSKVTYNLPKNSHDEVFNTNNPKKEKGCLSGCITMFIVLFFLFPIAIDIISFILNIIKEILS